MFNPHGNKTTDGVLIVEGLKVRDYDWETGTIVKDDTSPYMCENDYCGEDHWFLVERDGDRSPKSFNGSRMVALP